MGMYNSHFKKIEFKLLNEKIYKKSSKQIFQNLLEINNLNVSLKESDKLLLKNLSLKINKSETHCLMGKNGSGKSTLAKIIVGHPSYKINSGTISFNKIVINTFNPDTRALEGIFLCFQNPIEIQGVKNLDFLRKINNIKRQYLEKNLLDPLEFYLFINQKIN